MIASSVNCQPPRSGQQSSSAAAYPAVMGGDRMKKKPEKSVLDRLLNDWWVDAGVVLFVIVMLAITGLK